MMRVWLCPSARAARTNCCSSMKNLTANDSRHGQPFDEAEEQDEDEDFRVADEPDEPRGRCSASFSIGSKMKLAMMMMISRGMA